MMDAPSQGATLKMQAMESVSVLNVDWFQISAQQVAVD
jgi:hypothetical protein